MSSSRPSGLPADSATHLLTLLNQRRRDLRWSSRRLAREAGLTSSTLDRIQHGQAPSEAQLSDLDEALQLGGRLLRALDTDQAERWDPRVEPSELRRAHHGFRWPAELDDQVWIWIRPHTLEHNTAVQLSWGPFAFAAGYRLPPAGVVLTTDKYAEPSSIALIVTTNPPAYVRFGTGEAPAAAGTPDDIRPRWTDKR